MVKGMYKYLTINIYDQGYWGNLGTGVLSMLGFIAFGVLIVWFFGSRND